MTNLYITPWSISRSFQFNHSTSYCPPPHHTHIHTHAHATHTRTHARTHARTHTRTHARTHARPHARTHARTHTHTHGLKVPRCGDGTVGSTVLLYLLTPGPSRTSKQIGIRSLLTDAFNSNVYGPNLM